MAGRAPPLRRSGQMASISQRFRFPPKSGLDGRAHSRRLNVSPSVFRACTVLWHATSIFLVETHARFYSKKTLSTAEVEWQKFLEVYSSMGVRRVRPQWCRISRPSACESRFPICDHQRNMSKNARSSVRHYSRSAAAYRGD